MIVNGNEIALAGIKMLKDFLDREGYTMDSIAVEKNGAIIPKSRYDAEPLVDGDRLEIVTFVGGG